MNYGANVQWSKKERKLSKTIENKGMIENPEKMVDGPTDIIVIYCNALWVEVFPQKQG